MLQLLLVDDDRRRIDESRQAADWLKLGIDNIHAAMDFVQARKHIAGQNIDILVCRIDDKLDDGHCFLSWVQETHPEIATIVWSSQADFDIAQLAIRTGCLDYLVQPISQEIMAAALTRAVTKVQNIRAATEIHHYGQFWAQNPSLLLEHFWSDIFFEVIPNQAEDIHRAAKERNIPFDRASRFFPVVIAIKQWHVDMRFHNINLMEYLIKNLANEMIVENGKLGQIIHLSKNYLVAIMTTQSSIDSEQCKLKNYCENFIALCNKSMKCDLACLIGKMASAHELSSIVNEIIWNNRKNANIFNKVLFLTDSFTNTDNVNLPSVAELTVILQKKNRNEIARDINRWFKQLENIKNLDIGVIGKLQQDFMQAIHLMLSGKGVQEPDFWSNDKASFLLAESFRSVANLKIWVDYVTDQSLAALSTINPASSAVERVKNYIASHLGEELNRDNMAALVFLSPDYLTRLFQNETGMTLSQYIIHERIEFAKLLLSKTGMSIREVALNVGCFNVSHFSKFFRRNTNMSPIEFRKGNSGDLGD